MQVDGILSPLGNFFLCNILRLDPISIIAEGWPSHCPYMERVAREIDRGQSGGEYGRDIGSLQ